MIFLISIICIVIFLIFLVKIRNKRCEKFLIKYSIALSALWDINGRYKFFEDFDNLDERHVYDNEYFYENISCEDYLIYQLQFNQYIAGKNIKKSTINKEKFESYYKEVLKIELGRFRKDKHCYRKKKLLKMERKLFNECLLVPKTKFDIEILLCCSKMNGYIYKNKRQIFSIYEIGKLINRLNDKSGNFYKDREIWDAICRVERGKVTNKIRFAIFKRDGERCRICGSTYNLEIDHIRPISKGGKSTFDNLQTLCHRCNVEKGDTY